MNLFRKNYEDNNNSSWMGYTDLMSGFLVVFIIISSLLYKHYTEKVKEAEFAAKEAITAQREAEQKNDSLLYVLNELDKTSRQNQVLIDSLNRQRDLQNMIRSYKDVFVNTAGINVEFNYDRGSIVITKNDLEKDIFGSGKKDVSYPLDRYLQQIGSSLVDRTMSLQNEYHADIEMRIEGHTDPTWTFNGRKERDTDRCFKENLELSTERANNVYLYLLNNCGLSPTQKAFVYNHMVSVGCSYSLRKVAGNAHNPALDAQSRRIEFRIISK